MAAYDRLCGQVKTSAWNARKRKAREATPCPRNKGVHSCLLLNYCPTERTRTAQGGCSSGKAAKPGRYGSRPSSSSRMLRAALLMRCAEALIALSVSSPPVQVAM